MTEQIESQKQIADTEERNNLPAAPPAKAGLEKGLTDETLTREEFLQVVAQAEASHRYREVMAEKAENRALERRVGLEDSLEITDRYPISALYRWAGDVGIDLEDVTRALEIVRIPPEVQKQDLEEIGARKSVDLIRRDIERALNEDFIDGILSALRRYNPVQKIFMWNYYTHKNLGGNSVEVGANFGTQIIQRKPRRKWWRKFFPEKKEKIILAKLDISGEEGDIGTNRMMYVFLDLKVYNPLFLRACKDTLRQIAEKYGIEPGNMRVVREYYVPGEED